MRPGLLAILVACGSQDRPAPAARTFSEAEIAAYRADALARLDANQKRSCPGPKPLGATTAGASGPDILALVEGTGDVAACMGAPSAGPDPELAAETASPAAIARNQRCGAILDAAVHRASAHDGGCSPYQIGVRAEPKDRLSLLHLVHAIDVRAALLAPGDPAKAMGLLLDALRVLQDLQRGHVRVETVMLTTAAIHMVGKRADAILDAAELAPAFLGDLAGALDRLILGVPPFGDGVAGDRELLDIYAGLAPLDEAWIPHGGWDEELHNLPGGGSGDPRDEAATHLATSARIAALDDAACPAGATFEACRQGFETLARGAPRPPGGGAPEASRLDPKVIDALAVIRARGLADSVTRLAGTLIHLAELRLHVEALRTHACPPVLESPARLGKPLEIAVASGAVTIDRWTFRCR